MCGGRGGEILDKGIVVIVVVEGSAQGEGGEGGGVGKGALVGIRDPNKLDQKII